jgi:hypothetical protein
MNIDRLIELLIKEVEQLYQNEMCSYLDEEEEEELQKLIEQWKKIQ